MHGFFARVWCRWPNGIIFGGMIEIISINDTVEFERIFFLTFYAPVWTIGHIQISEIAPLCKYFAHNKVTENQYAAILSISSNKTKFEIYDCSYKIRYTLYYIRMNGVICEYTTKKDYLLTFHKTCSDLCMSYCPHVCMKSSKKHSLKFHGIVY